MKVQALVAHILHHVNAEAADSDPSQVAGVADRAQLVRSAVQGLRTDPRDLAIRDSLQVIYDAIPDRAGQSSFRNVLVNMRASGETRPQLAIQTWVGKNRETR